MELRPSPPQKNFFHLRPPEDDQANLLINLRKLVTFIFFQNVRGQPSIADYAAAIAAPIPAPAAVPPMTYPARAPTATRAAAVPTTAITGTPKAVPKAAIPIDFSILVVGLIQPNCQTVDAGMGQIIVNKETQVALKILNGIVRNWCRKAAGGDRLHNLHHQFREVE